MDPFFSLFAPIVDAWKAHAYGLVALSCLFAVLNVAFRVKSPAEWVVVLDSFPRVHATLALLRAIGVQPVEACEALRRIVTGEKPKSIGPTSA